MEKIPVKILLMEHLDISLAKATKLAKMLLTLLLSKLVVLGLIPVMRPQILQLEVSVALEMMKRVLILRTQLLVMKAAGVICLALEVLQPLLETKAVTVTDVVKIVIIL